MLALAIAVLLIGAPRPARAASALVSLPSGEPVRMLLAPRGLLLGSDAGLYQLQGMSWSLSFARGAVRDLARGPAATWIATRRGLFVWPDDGSAPLPVGLGAGARVRSVAVDSRGAVYAGTEVGLFVREPDGEQFRRTHDLPAGEVLAVRSAGQAVFVATPGRIWSRASGERFRVRLRSLKEGWYELVAATITESGPLLAVPRGLWQLSERNSGVRRLELATGELRAAAVHSKELWLASARGLYVLPLARLASAPPELVQGGEAIDLVGDRGRLLVALGRELIAVSRASTVAPPSSRSFAAESRRPRPDLPVLQRAVLRYQGLEPQRLERAEAKARRAALLPELRLAFGWSRDRAHERDADQTFTSGALRELLDRTRERDVGLELSLQLVWDLAEHRDPRRLIAISRERREVVELRDQVLERFNRLYFEWLRVRARVPEAGSEAEHLELDLRSRELAAGLDGWTGGLFTRLERSRNAR